jgi:hypothetical protein
MDIVSERVIVVERLLRHQLEYEMQYTFRVFELFHDI